MPTGSLNPAVIEPISTTIYSNPATTVAPSVGRVISQPQTPEIIQAAPINQPPADITNIYPKASPQPVVTLPDITKMTNDLLTSGQLLSDIPVAATHQSSNSPTEAGQMTAVQDPIMGSIRLAKTPITTETVTSTSGWEGSSSDHLKKIILVLTTLTLIVIGASIWSSLRANDRSLSHPNAETPRVFQPDTIPAATLAQ